ncbi:hypothetical protein QQP08_010374 [Theobroma cacao]|nr:hypothetical protein QQP08_010374 [Theobroma cacao]
MCYRVHCPMSKNEATHPPFKVPSEGNVALESQHVLDKVTNAADGTERNGTPVYNLLYLKRNCSLLLKVRGQHFLMLMEAKFFSLCPGRVRPYDEDSQYALTVEVSPFGIAKYQSDLQSQDNQSS